MRYVCPKCGDTDFERDVSYITYSTQYFQFNNKEYPDFQDESISDPDNFENHSGYKCCTCDFEFFSADELITQDDWDDIEKFKLLDKELESE